MRDVLQFFDKADTTIRGAGFGWEIDNVQNFDINKIDVEFFAMQFTFCTMSSSGINNQTVEKLFDRFMDAKNGKDPDPYLKIPNRRQREIIRVVWQDPARFLDNIRSKKTDEERIKYIRTIPQMGPKSSRHFARNIGIDCVKPDRWMDRLADHYEFISPDDLCKYIHENRPKYRLGTVDVILWRYCNLTRSLE